MARTPLSDASAVTAAILNGILDHDAIVIPGASQSGKIYGTIQAAHDAGCKDIKFFGTPTEAVTLSENGGRLSGGGWDNSILTGILTISGTRWQLENFKSLNSPGDAIIVTGNLVYFRGLWIKTPTTKGFEIESAISRIKITDCYIDTPGNIGISIASSASLIDIINTEILASVSDSLKIAGTASRVLFQGGGIDTSGAHGVNITGDATGITIRPNYIKSCVGTGLKNDSTLITKCSYGGIKYDNNGTNIDAATMVDEGGNIDIA